MVKFVENTIKKMSTDKENYEVLKYGFITLSQFLFGFIVLLGVAYFLNVFYEVLISSITFTIIRMLSGGAHASSPVRCNIIGCIIFTLIGKLSLVLGGVVNSQYYIYIIPIIAVISLIMINKFGYSTIDNKLLNEYNYGKKLLKYSYIYLITWVILMNIFLYNEYYLIVLSSILGLIWHNISLTMLGKSVVDSLDYIFKNILKV